jgi:hypothetical protein
METGVIVGALIFKAIDHDTATIEPHFGMPRRGRFRKPCSCTQEDEATSNAASATSQRRGRCVPERQKFLVIANRDVATHWVFRERTMSNYLGETVRLVKLTNQPVGILTNASIVELEQLTSGFVSRNDITSARNIIGPMLNAYDPNFVSRVKDFEQSGLCSETYLTRYTLPHEVAPFTDAVRGLAQALEDRSAVLDRPGNLVHAALGNAAWVGGAAAAAAAVFAVDPTLAVPSMLFAAGFAALRRIDGPGIGAPALPPRPARPANWLTSRSGRYCTLNVDDPSTRRIRPTVGRHGNLCVAFGHLGVMPADHADRERHLKRLGFVETWPNHWDAPDESWVRFKDHRTFYGFKDGYFIDTVDGVGPRSF